MPRAHRYAVVMAGGSGTRFWPRSRMRTPKQLLRIAGSKTMLQETVARICPPVRREHVLAVVGRVHAAAVRRQLPNLPARNLLAEPAGRNTAAAIAFAALVLERRAPRGVMAVLPADHVVSDRAAFRADLSYAFDLAAASEALVTFGIVPTRPETGYGYIRPDPTRPGPALGSDGRAAWVERFVEKPDRARAEAMLAENCLWNAGIFVWRVDVILAALREHLPAVIDPLERALARGGAAALARAYARLPAVSIDAGVLERAERVLVVRARFPWSDVGSWQALEELWGGPGVSNAVRGRVLAVDSAGCVVDSPDRLVALLGVSDLVVVDAGDVVLVCRKDRAQDVRRLVDALAARGLGRYR